MGDENNQSQLGSLAYEERLNSLADLAVLDRSLATIPMYLLLLTAILMTTPISKRFPAEMFYFTLFTAVLCVARLLIAKLWKKIYHIKRGGIYRNLFLWSYALASLSWGLFCGIIVLRLELGWTSFFVLIITLGICAASVPTLSPKYSLSRLHLIFIFSPSLVATLFFVGGLKGYALACFFASFFVLLLMQSKIQNSEYWSAIQNHARLQAIIDSLPGTLSWMSSDLKYLGMNQNLINLWNFNPDQIIGKPVGFSDKKTGLRKFVEDLFASEQDQKSKEVVVDVRGEIKNYFIVGSKYNHNTEAVVLGIDFTEYQKTFKELLFRREQSKRVAKLASLGEVAANVSDEIQAPTLVIKSKIEELKGGLYAGKAEMLSAADEIYQEAAKLNKLSLLLRRFSSIEKEQEVKMILISDLIDAAFVFCAERLKNNNIMLIVENSEKELQIYAQFNSILEVLLNLINNALDAVKNILEREKQWIKIAVSKNEFGIEISVEDGGAGIPKEFKDHLFEPFSMTKNTGQSTGIGLSNSREIIEKMGGLLTLDDASAHTRFVISFPIGAEIGKLPSLEEVAKAA